MAKNTARRSALADAGIAVLAREGSRGLTHRAIDDEAGVPTGTTSNYFRSRDALVAGLFERIGERLAPTPEDLARRATQTPDRALFADYLRDIVRRLSTDADVTRALFELRLESGRRGELAAVLGPWLRAGFEADVAFNRSAGLPGGRREIALFHYAIDGLLLDRLTTPIDPDIPTDDVVDALVAGLLPER
ncbi:transcriptional regulator, TetR family [Cellulosimicrobium aquatile]|uniref:TetR family transcriptional regulator n=2 Tax=Cellulosimicrobium TaxID=157920 RepID=A0A4Y8R6Y7_9MICO|nr:MULTISPECIES: TetR/AcrR family transcriptional regulator [Cellulosimicrobium]TGA74091.1 TetR family transcriptional regulator [Cellulosimicrobium terreum]MCM3535094.1 TetR family transcriptional regulator [Cellulosimicrobium funkei]NMF28126.1 TetR family transcriptional regulator [Cellulosimicrobium aquatile]TFF17381.1 TetR family transcriptional regulator [Cellulosimicrobium funkei]SIQ07558.1 transcriptional regulator, TetR family [Cellulosimicrobium aquatile]